MFESSKEMTCLHCLYHGFELCTNPRCDRFGNVTDYKDSCEHWERKVYHSLNFKSEKRTTYHGYTIRDIIRSKEWK